MDKFVDYGKLRKNKKIRNFYVYLMIKLNIKYLFILFGFNYLNRITIFNIIFTNFFKS